MTRVTQQMEEEMCNVAQQNQEEINRVKEELEEHRARLLAEAKARDENSRYASNTVAGCITSVAFPLFCILIFIFLIECCRKCSFALHKKRRRSALWR